MEIFAWVAIGYWGWHQASGLIRYATAIVFPLAVAAVWGTFRVPGDASASGRALVPVPGLIRLMIELATLSFAVWALLDQDQTVLGLAVGAATLLHYLLSYDRSQWLLRK